MWGLLESPWIAWSLTAVSAMAAYLLWAQSYWSRRGIPQTRPIPILGDLWDAFIMRRTIGTILQEIYRKFDPAPFVGFYKILNTPVLLIRDPDLVKEVLVQNFASFQQNEVVYPEGKDPILSENPFAASFERWKGLRIKMTQLLSPARVRLAFTDVEESSRALVNYVEACGEHTSIDGNLLCKRYTSHATARVLFGIESHSLEPGAAPGPLFDRGNAIFNGGFVTVLRFIAFTHCPSLLKILGYRLTPNSTIDFFSKLIHDSVEYRQKEGIKRDDLIQFASNSITVDGKVDQTLLRSMTSQALSAYIDMFETSSLVMGVTLMMLATHPDQQAKLRAELQDVSGDVLAQADSVNSLPLLDWVIKESMRLYPVADVLRRSSTKTTVLRSGGHSVTLKPGDVVYVSMDALHRDPTLYNEPDRFIPERFAPAQVESRHKMVYLPFGEGPRMCPGYRYALQQIKVAVAALLLRFEVRPAPEQVLPLQRDPTAVLFGFTGGNWLRFHKVVAPSST